MDSSELLWLLNARIAFRTQWAMRPRYRKPAVSEAALRWELDYDFARCGCDEVSPDWGLSADKQYNPFLKPQKRFRWTVAE